MVEGVRVRGRAWACMSVHVSALAPTRRRLAHLSRACRPILVLERGQRGPAFGNALLKRPFNLLVRCSVQILSERGVLCC